jgi:hypothetical protein
MPIPIENVPGLVEQHFGALLHAKEEYEDYMRRVDIEADPELRESYQRLAVGAMERANVLKSEAEDLIRQFEAAGGTVDRDPAWGPATDWIFTPTSRR